MPPKGVKSSSKRARQYEHIKESAQKRGRSAGRAKQIAAATVNKARREAGETSPSGTRKGREGSAKTSAKRSSAKKSASSGARRRSSSRSGSKSAGARKK